MKEKQLLFCEKYLQSYDEYLSAEFAGYSPSYAKILLKKPEIIKYIKKHSIANSDEILAYLTKVMRTDETKASHSKSSITIKDRIKAAELLAKRYNTFSEKQESNTTPVIILGENELV